MYYDWDKILKEKNDSELFQALNEFDLPEERRITAEKLLLEKKIIAKNSEGNYFKEIIDKEYLVLTENSIKSNSIENTLSILSQNGLDSESSKRLIENYSVWKRNNRRQQRMLLTLCLIGFIMEILSEVVSNLNFLTPIVSFLFFLTMIPIIWPIFTGSGFTKKEIFKVLTPEN